MRRDGGQVDSRGDSMPLPRGCQAVCQPLAAPAGLVPPGGCTSPRCRPRGHLAATGIGRRRLKAGAGRRARPTRIHGKRAGRIGRDSAGTAGLRIWGGLGALEAVEGDLVRRQSKRFVPSPPRSAEEAMVAVRSTYRQTLCPPCGKVRPRAGIPRPRRRGPPERVLQSTASLPGVRGGRWHMTRCSGPQMAGALLPHVPGRWARSAHCQCVLAFARPHLGAAEWLMNGVPVTCRPGQVDHAERPPKGAESPHTWPPEGCNRAVWIFSAATFLTQRSWRLYCTWH